MSDVTGAGTAVSGIAQAAASITSANVQAEAAKSVANTYADATKYGENLVQGRYDTTRSDLMPYQTTGQSANDAISNNLGTYGLNSSNYLSAMQDSNPQVNAYRLDTPQSQNNSTVPGSMSQSELEATPGYQFTRDQGLQAVQNSAAARGLGVSGAALKGAATYATGLANSTYKDQFNIKQQQFSDQLSKDNQNFGQSQSQYTDAYNTANLGFNQQQQQFTNNQAMGNSQQAWLSDSANRLSSVQSQGENAAAQTGSNGLQSAVAQSGIATSGASGQAAATLSGANAASSGINGLANAFSQTNAQQNASGNTNWLSSLFGSGSSSGSGTSSATGQGNYYNSYGSGTGTSYGTYNSETGY